MVDATEAVIFGFDGVLIDSERVQVDCIIEVLARWDVDVAYVDFGHLFGSVDADEQWDELGRWSGRTARELDEELRLWHRLLGRPASESGRLCHGDGATTRVPAAGRR
jgi:beta-phosphoglucomutase-like phosphatase (HAD superfamily)